MGQVGLPHGVEEGIKGVKRQRRRVRKWERCKWGGGGAKPVQVNQIALSWIVE